MTARKKPEPSPVRGKVSIEVEYTEADYVSALASVCIDVGMYEIVNLPGIREKLEERFHDAVLDQLRRRLITKDD